MLETFQVIMLLSPLNTVEYLVSCSTALLFYLLLIFIQTKVSAWKKTIFVSPDGSDQWCQINPNLPCRTLDKAFAVANDRGANSTLISVQGGHYNISSNINFKNVHDFALKGNEEVVAMCINPNINISLSFILSDNLLIERITFYQCGNWHKSTVGDPTFPHDKQALFVTALYFNYCRNLTLHKLRVIETPGIAINMYDVGGVNVYDCEFVSNKPISVNMSSLTAENSDFARAGGGVFLQLGIAVFNPVPLSDREHALYVNNHTYIFKGCNFTKNEAPKPNLNGTIDSPAVPFSRGGGLAFYIAGNGSNNHILIENSTFLQNEAQWGGGLQLEVQTHGQNNSFIVRGTTFKNNKASFSGGGVRMGNIEHSPESFLPNHFHFISCQFIENIATWGGGMSVYGATQTVPNDSYGNPVDRKMVFSTCTWRGNEANVGSAFGAFLFNTNTNEIGPRTPFVIELEHCSVKENKVSIVEDTLVLGQGAVYTVEVPIILKGETSFSDNSYTAIVLDTATLYIKDTVLFTNNTGFRGGALALYGKSKMFLFSGSVLTFENNFAVQKGGAIYFATTGPRLVSFKATGLNASPCFVAYEKWEVDYNKWNTSIVFRGNTVDELGLGDSIYATTLKNCRRAGETRKMNSAFAWKFVKFLTKNGTASTAQAAIRTDPISMKCNRSDWEKPPSEQFKVTAILIDEKRNHVPGQILVELNSTTVALTKSNLFLSKNNTLSPLILVGRKGDSFNVTLTTIGQQIVRKRIDNLVLSSCKDGFIQRGKSCVCASDNEPGIAYCKVKKGKVYIKKGYWAGKTKEGKFLTHYCPTGYCRCKNVCLYKQGHMCSSNRDGKSFLCGECKQGYSVLIGSEKCEKCNNWNLLWVILYALVLLVLVMLIMMINIDVFTGYLNAWLYFYQVITVIVIEGFEFDLVMQFIIGISNLRIRVGTGWCLMNGIDEADKLVIMYLIPTYVLIVAFVLAKAVRVFPNWCFSRRIRSRYGSFGSICTILVFCYTDIVTVSLEILNPAYEDKTVVLYEDGGVQFFKKKHILYGAIALVYLVTVGIFFPLTLLCRPFFFRVLPCLTNLRGVYDSLQDVLKNEYRWSAAFYFLARFLLLVLFILQSSPLKRVLIEGACVLILVFYIHMKPYQPQYEWINTSDIILLTNLTLIAVISTGTSVQNPKDTTAKVLKVLIKVLAYAPLAYAILYLLLIRYIWTRLVPVLAPEHHDTDNTESTTTPILEI